MSSMTRSQRHGCCATEQQRELKRQQDREQRRMARQHESDTRRSERLANVALSLGFMGCSTLPS